MTRRIAENQVARNLLNQIGLSRVKIDKYSQEIATGLKVSSAGDTAKPATINQFQTTLNKIDNYRTLISSSTSFLQYQDDSLTSAHELLTRAQELATQGANGTYTPEERQQIASEVWELREGLVQLANGTYQGKYVWNGTITNSPPFNPQTYAVPATGASSTRYAFDNTAFGATTEQGVGVSDQISVRLYSRADSVWDRAIGAVERLGRALSGYETLPAPPALPDGTGAAYVFPADQVRQGDDIAAALDAIKVAREEDIQVERVSIGGRMERLQIASSLLDLGKSDAERVLAQLSEADVTESASQLALAQTAFEASLTLTTRLLNLSVLDYL